MESLYDLVDLIKSSDEYKELKDNENKMINDKEFISLSIIFKTNESKYNDLVKYKQDLTNITKELSLSKENLYNLDVVKDYFNSLNKVNKLLREVSELIKDGVI